LKDTAEIETAAIAFFKEQTSKNVSFVDCINMAYLDRGGLEYIFSFDKVYKQKGFRTVEELI
jgi:predicted nucleic acid-binding protein